MKTAERSLAAAKTNLVNTGSIEDVSANYNQVLALMVAEHNLVLAGLGRWFRADYGSGAESLNRFLAEREDAVVTALDEHSREVRAALAMMPDLLDGLPDLSVADRNVFEQALKEPLLGGVSAAAARIREHGSDEETVRAMLAATDVQAHDWVVDNPRAWILDNPDQRQRAEDDFRAMTSGRPARDAIRDSRNAVLYRQAQSSPEGIDILKTYASSPQARAALMTAKDHSTIQRVSEQRDLSSARDILAHASDNIARPGRLAKSRSGSKKKKAAVGLNNQIVSDALRLNPDLEDALFLEEIAAARERLMKQYPVLAENGNEPENGTNLTDEQAWEVWINHPKTPKSPNSKPQPKRVKVLWDAEREKISRKYPDVFTRQAAREAEARQRAEEARRRAEEEARQRASSSQSGSRQAGSQYSRSTRPPRQEQKASQPTELSKEELEVIYDDIVIELQRSRSRVDAHSFEGFDRETVYWVIDRIMKARRESEAHGKPVTDKAIYIQFMKLSGAANSHPKPEDEEAAKIMNAMMGNASGKLPF